VLQEPPDYDPAKPAAWEGVEIQRVYFDLARLPESKAEAHREAQKYYYRNEFQVRRCGCGLWCGRACKSWRV
jgi:hypothetical protein